MWLWEAQIHPAGQMLQWRPTVSAHCINRGKSLKSCFLRELQCHWRLHECDINPAALKIISAGIRTGQSSQPGAEEKTGATSGLSRRSCTHVVQSRLGERMPASIKKEKKNLTAPVFLFSWSSCSVHFRTVGFGICGALRGDGSRRVGITVWHVRVLRCDPAIKTNPPGMMKALFLLGSISTESRVQCK